MHRYVIHFYYCGNHLVLLIIITGLYVIILESKQMSRNVRQRTCGCVYSLIRIFTGRILDSQVCKVSSLGQRGLWSDCADAQADLSLLRAQMSEGTFSAVAAHLKCHSVPARLMKTKTSPNYMTVRENSRLLISQTARDSHYPRAFRRKSGDSVIPIVRPSGQPSVCKVTLLLLEHLS